jgi:hypothetical protein
MCAIKKDPPRRVSAFLDVSTITWNVSKLEEFMSPMDVEAVHQIPISHLRQLDFFACHLYLIIKDIRFPWFIRPTLF